MDLPRKNKKKSWKKHLRLAINKDECEEKSLEDIIDDVINAIKDNYYSDNIKKCIKKYWFTKQIEEWKKDDNNKNKEPADNELMEIVKEDLKIRIANTMLELKKQKI